MKIILGLTGSVATTIAPKIIDALRATNNCEVVVVMTEKATHFYRPQDLALKSNVKVYTDNEEWTWEHEHWENSNNMWKKGDPILHIDLSKDASALVIAPASMNTIAKMANGITDNLLTSLYAAWDTNRPVVVAPAMNTRMLKSLPNERNIIELGHHQNINIVNPIEKGLACGDFGMGALANIDDIVKATQKALRWRFPILIIINAAICPGVPVGEHLGAFGAFRGHGKRHCGVDLYVPSDKQNAVIAVESGVVVEIDSFTGPSAGSPWWNDTMCVKVEGASGVVGYGEIMLSEDNPIKLGDNLIRGQTIGYVKQVLKDDQLRSDIKGHSCSMLHLQLYKHGMVSHERAWLHEEANPPDGVLDPTKFLLDSSYYWSEEHPKELTK